MKHRALPLVVVLSAMLGFARTATDNDTARAIKGAHLLHGSMQNPDDLQVSRALITGGNVCIDYRTRSGSGAMNTGVAVYESQKNLLFVDNSWIWQRDCLFGKYAQRREGADVTEAVTTALERQSTRARNENEGAVAKVVPPVETAPRSASSTPQALVPPSRIGKTLTAPPVATAPAEPRLPVDNARDAKEVETQRGASAPVGRTDVPVQRAETVVPTPSDTRGAIAPAPVATAAVPPRPAAAPAETHLAGMLIIGTSGAIPGMPSSAPESLGDAARRLKKERLQRLQTQQRQLP